MKKEDKTLLLLQNFKFLCEELITKGEHAADFETFKTVSRELGVSNNELKTLYNASLTAFRVRQSFKQNKKRKWLPEERELITLFYETFTKLPGIKPLDGEKKNKNMKAFWQSLAKLLDRNSGSVSTFFRQGMNQDEKQDVKPKNEETETPQNSPNANHFKPETFFEQLKYLTEYVSEGAKKDQEIASLKAQLQHKEYLLSEQSKILNQFSEKFSKMEQECQDLRSVFDELGTYNASKYEKLG